MVKIGDLIELEISTLSNSGSGAGSYFTGANCTVFVPLSVPGDMLKVIITSQKNAYFEGKIVEIIKPSPERINPSCGHFGICGACDWLNIKYTKQVQEKERLLGYFFKKNNIDIPAIETIEAISPLNYRDRVRFTNGGFISKEKNDIVKINECRIINPLFKKLIEEQATGNASFGYDCKTKSITKNKAYYYFEDIEFAYHPASFVQSSFEMNKLLIETVLKLSDGNDILDLYCGNGNFSIPLSRKAGHVSAVEGSKDGFLLLHENMRNNIVKNITAYNKDVHSFIKKSKKYDCIVLDPPRTGAGNLLLSASKKTRRIVYVSCNPEMMAKEIKTLSKEFAVEKLIFIDMLPQTRHIEAVCLLRRR